MFTSSTKRPSWLRPAYLGLSLVLAGGLLYYSLSGIDLAGVVQTILTASPSWIAAMSLVTAHYYAYGATSPGASYRQLLMEAAVSAAASRAAPNVAISKKVGSPV